MAVRSPKNSTQIYGSNWRTTDLAVIELECIKRGGYWDMNGVRCGQGLAHHIVAFSKIVWPWIFWHRWNKDLILPEIIRNRCQVAIYGPSSSGKSSTLALYVLVMYYAFPDKTTVLVSSTTRDALELRIWGEIKMLHKEAKQKYDWLPGHLTDSKQLISTDGKDVEGRDFRNGLIGRPCKRGSEWVGLGDYVGIKNENMYVVADECFVAGTRISTPHGLVNIENISIGDEVITAIGPRCVIATRVRMAERLLKVSFKDKRFLVCTENHPFFTNKGWVKAKELNETHYVFSPNETLQILRDNDPGEERKLQCKDFLRSILRSEMDAQQTGFDSAQRGENQCFQKKVLSRAPGASDKTIGKHSEKSSNEFSWGEGKDDCFIESNWTQAEDTLRQWDWTDESGIHSVKLVSRGVQQLRCSDKERIGFWLSLPLQNRLGISRIEISRRSGRNESSCGTSKTSRQQKREVTSGSWVDSVKVYKQGSVQRFGQSAFKHPVYNLEVEGHPSYTANGFVVHNCQLMPDGFLKSIANLRSNKQCRTYCLGNLNDLSTPLGQAAEPEFGWDSLQDSDISRAYNTRWCDGRAIQLIGMDSPQLDYPEDAEPFGPLIGRRYIEQCAQDYGRDTPLFNMFASGKIPRGTLDNRIISKQICLKFSAFEEVTWGHEPITKLYGMDVSYTAEHGDRTVGIPMAFGKDTDGKIRLACLERPLIFSPSDRATGTIEEQVASQLMAECKRLDIPPTHVFYDGTGRSSFTAALMRLWSTSVNPIEFGGTATNRPNFIGKRYHEDNGMKQQKGDLLPCDAVFGKMVSELWFAFRYLVEADQCRQLSEEVAKEAYLRLWKLTANNKMDVEPKKDLKLRLGRSCDLADALVCGIEGARRLGFSLGQLGGETKRRSVWLRQLNQEYKELQQSTELAVA